MEIRLSGEALRAIREHGARAYPHECCGALLGAAGPDGKRVTRILPIDNARTDSAPNRFLVTDRDYLRAERRAAEEGVDLLGFYHSHPDHPAEPSRYDLDHALPWFSYIIVAVARGTPGKVTSWVLSEDRSRFCEERVVPFPGAGLRDPSPGWAPPPQPGAE